MIKDRWDQINSRMLDALFAIRRAQEADPYVDDCPSARIEGKQERTRQITEAKQLLTDVLHDLEALKP